MKKIGKRLAALSAALLIGYAVFTPMGALRTAVLMAGYPAQAVTMDVRRATAKDLHIKNMDNLAGCVVYRICGNTPYEGATDTNLENWIVHQHGILYTAQYYGYC